MKKILFKKRMIRIVFITLFLITVSTMQVFAKCGTKLTLQIAEMNWQSAGILAHVTQKILRDGFDCKTKLVPGDTVPTTSSMLAKGKPHIAPELWVGNMSETWKKIKKKGNLYNAGNTFSLGPVEGWFIPDYVYNANPGLRSIYDLKKYADLFKEASSRGKGRIYSCQPGWKCEIVNENLYKALGLTKTYELFSPGSGANLDASIARKVVQKKPILTYYWGPTAILGKYKLKKLDMGEHDPKKWACLTDKNCDNPQATAWIVNEVVVLVNVELKKAKHEANFLSKLQIPNNVLNDVLAWMVEERSSNEETANYFLKNYENIWNKWVPASATKKLKKKI